MFTDSTVRMPLDLGHNISTYILSDKSHYSSRDGSSAAIAASRHPNVAGRLLRAVLFVRRRCSAGEIEHF
jgi:hypothetical protein